MKIVSVFFFFYFRISSCRGMPLPAGVLVYSICLSHLPPRMALTLLGENLFWFFPGRGPTSLAHIHQLLLKIKHSMGFPGGASDKESACQCRRHKSVGSIPGSGRSPEGGHSNLLQYSCWRIPWTDGLAGYKSERHKASEMTEMT